MGCASNKETQVSPSNAPGRGVSFNVLHGYGPVPPQAEKKRPCMCPTTGLDHAIEELTENPAAGLADLQTALVRAGKDATRQQRVKAKVPEIFRLLPTAMEGLRGKTRLWSFSQVMQSMLAACDVIARCATICNDPSLRGTQVVIAEKAIKHCQCCLVDFLKQSQTWMDWSKGKQNSDADSGTEKHPWLGHDMCKNSSKVASAVALATIALLMLEANAPECKQEFVETGGITAALKAMRTENVDDDDDGAKGRAAQRKEKVGVGIKTKESLALMLSLLSDTPASVAAILRQGGTSTLIPYVEEPEKYDVSNDMHRYCVTVLEACLPNVEACPSARGRVQVAIDKDRVQAAIDKGAFRLAWRTAKSQDDSIAVVRHGTSVKDGIASHKAELAIASNKAEQYSKTMRLKRLAAATAECLSPRRRPGRLKVDEQK